MENLTARQEQALECIRRSIRENGYPPTMREIGAAMRIRSTNGVTDHLRALERKGYIRRGDDLKSRDIHVIGKGIEKTVCTCEGSAGLRARIRELESKLSRILQAAE